MSRRRANSLISLGLAFISAAVIVGAAGCRTSSGPTNSTASATATTPSAQTPCGNLGGTLDAKQTCQVHNATPTYKLDFQFPVDYPDQQVVTDFLTRRRNDFIDWTGQNPLRGRPIPYQLNIIGKEYRSGAPPSGTQSLVFEIGDDTGVHPVTTFKAFNYDLAKHAAITFDTLFKPGTDPLAVLKPIVQGELDKHGATGSLTLDELGVDAYQNFAITDDAVIFFFNQDGLLPHEKGSLKVTVPRTELAPLLA